MPLSIGSTLAGKLVRKKLGEEKAKRVFKSASSHGKPVSVKTSKHGSSKTVSKPKVSAESESEVKPKGFKPVVGVLHQTGHGVVAEKIEEAAEEEKPVSEHKTISATPVSTSLYTKPVSKDEKTGVLPSKYREAEQQKESYKQGFLSSIKSEGKNIVEAKKYLNKVESKIKEVSKYEGDKNIVWTTEDGKTYTTGEYLDLLKKEKERAEKVKSGAYKRMGETVKTSPLNYLKLSAYAHKLKGYIKKGYYGVEEKGKIRLYPSKKLYEKEQLIKKEGEYTVSLHRRAEKGDIGANLELFGRGVAVSLGSWSGASKGLQWWIKPSLNMNEEWYRKEGETFGGLKWEWEHGDFLKKGEMIVGSPGGILVSAPIGGYAVGRGVGVLSRVAPSAGKAAKVGFGVFGAAGAGMAGYDVYQTAVVEKNIPEAATKGLIYGSSFLFAAKTYKTGYRSGYRKANVRWMMKHKPTFETIITKKVPTSKGMVFEGFEKTEWKYSLGRKITTTTAFRGVQKGKYTYTFGKGKGTMRYGFFKPKTKVFEIRPFSSVAKDSKFLTIQRGKVSTGIIKMGEEHPTVFFQEGEPKVVLDKRFATRSAWVEGVSVENRRFLPFSMEGTVSEKKGFTVYSRGKKPDFLRPVRGGSSGKLNTLYKTETVKVVTATKPFLETFYTSKTTGVPVVPVSVSQEINVKPFSQVRGESVFVGTRKPSVSFSAKHFVEAKKTEKLKNIPLSSHGLKISQVEKNVFLQRSGNKILKETVSQHKEVEKVSKVEVGKTVLYSPVFSQMQDVFSKVKSVKFKTSALKSESLQMKEDVLKTDFFTSSLPVMHTVIGSPLKKGKKKTVKKKRMFKSKKKKRRKKTLLAEPFSVQESQIRFGKATHPKPTKKIWEMGFKTGWKIPTVEMMKKSKKRRLL